MDAFKRRRRDRLIGAEWAVVAASAMTGNLSVSRPTSGKRCARRTPTKCDGRVAVDALDQAVHLMGGLAGRGPIRTCAIPASPRPTSVDAPRARGTVRPRQCFGNGMTGT